MLGTILGLIILGLDIWAIVNIISSPEKGSTMLIWVIMPLLPGIGLLVWYFAGPRAPGRDLISTH